MSEIEALREFARWVLQEGPFSGCDLDGGDVQDEAERLGLLRVVKYDPQKHGEGLRDLEPGDLMYEFAYPVEGGGL